MIGSNRRRRAASRETVPRVSKFAYYLHAAFCAAWFAGSTCTAADCNGNGTEDFSDVRLGTSPDCNDDGVPDECERRTTAWEFVERYEIAGTALAVAAASWSAAEPADAAVLWTRGGHLGVTTVARSTFENAAILDHDLPPAKLGPRPSILVVDLDASGTPDIVVPSTRGFAVIQGRIGNTWSEPKIVDAGSALLSLRFGHVDEDEPPECLAIDPGARALLVLDRRPDSSYESTQRVSIDDAPTALATGDFDRDGDDDAIVAASKRMWLLSTDDGSLSPPLEIGRSTGEIRVLRTLLPHADDLDAIVFGAGSHGLSWRLRGLPGPAPRLEMISRLEVPGPGAPALEGAAIDRAALVPDSRSGRRDWVVGSESSETWRVLMSDTNGGVHAWAPFPAAFDAADLSVSPATETAPEELFVARDRELAIARLGTEVDRRVPRVEPLASVEIGPEDVLASSIALGDFDGDGDLDAIGLARASDPPRTRLAVRWNESARSDAAIETLEFRTGVPFSIEHSNANYLIAADLDADGVDDVLLQGSEANATETVAMIANGDGTFRESARTAVGDFIVPGGPRVTVCDLDRDGSVDLLGPTALAGRRGLLRIVRNDGRGGFGTPEEIDTQVNAATADDLDGDDWPEIISVLAAENPRIGVHRNDGGRFDPPIYFEHAAAVPSQRATLPIATGDLDGDGDVDVVVAHAGRITSFRNDGFRSVGNDGISSSSSRCG